MKRWKKWLRNENGEMVTEATIVMAVTVMVIFFLLNIAIFVMQRGMFTVWVNQAAVELAGDYQNWIGSVNDPGEVLQHMKIRQDKTKFELFHPAEVPDRSMEMVRARFVSKGSRKVIVVFGSRYYQVLSINPCAYFGFDTMYLVKAQGSAVCYDIHNEMMER
ncbi:MAG: hypothetical protein MR965_07870 [Lachnospiraceae bacterium]|nr:hypothetical protein [Lachnospiraceae bacterium]